ncbi:P-loop NTPase fold protein [Terasakiella pusilla]|uniref:P-loop NTPase fold protein n=1 Tax=Terasakiella pusilla TaxID=64973 RepID=UPI003AA8F071
MNLPQAWIDLPKITALSDAPVLQSHIGEGDRFQLSRSMGPVLDILRHKDTQTPLSIALYGTWGSGKSSAMHWLQAGLKVWNDKLPEHNHGQSKDDLWPHTISVNFYPWKYSTKEDVWRGLIVEIIIACIKHNKDQNVTVNEVVSKFSGFLGKKLITALSALKLKGTFAGVGGEVDVEKLVKVFDNQDVSPETAYLNDFEETFSTWVTEILKPTKSEGQAQPFMRYRLVVFIDDLDRCLPEVALQVLEALKLYLNIPGLVFVLGLDQKVVQQLVCKHYSKLGVDEEKAKQYLSKMFQVEIPLAPHESEIELYVDGLVSDTQWQDLGIDNDQKQKDVFLKVIRELGDYSPRETKRLVNSILLQARGAQFMASQPNELTPTQAVQIHLIEEVLRRHYPKQDRWLRLRKSQKFFLDWDLPRQDEEINSVERTLKADTHLNILMDIKPFPTEPQLEMMRIKEINKDFKSWVEKETGKPWEEVEQEQFRNITRLDFWGASFTDWSALSKLQNLKHLELANSNFLDLEILTNLKNLSHISLSYGLLETLELLPEIKTLRTLSLNELDLRESAFLLKMPKLISLGLAQCKGTSLINLATLKQLKGLSLLNADIDDYSTLSQLENLEIIYLGGSNITSLAPLKNLQNLLVLTLPESFANTSEVNELQTKIPNLNLAFNY